MASSADTAVILPFVYKDEKQVSAFLACGINKDKVTLKMYRARMYSKFKFDNNHDSLNANTLALEFMYLNQRIFGDSIFSLTDERLFSKPNNKSKRRIIWLTSSKSSRSVSPTSSSTWVRFTELRCYNSIDDGNQGQLVGVAPGGTPNYPGGGTQTCYEQSFYLMVSGGLTSIPTSDVTISTDPSGSGGVTYSAINNGYWWSEEPCPDPNGWQEPDAPSCNGGTVLGWQPTYINAVSWTLGAILDLDQTKTDWLNANLDVRAQVWYYLFQSTASSSLPEETKKENAVNHINRLMANEEYRNFNQNHQATTTIPNSVWWEDDAWLSNPNNFNLDITNATNEYDLTIAEKLLIAKYPIQAFIIRQNMDEAFAMSDTKMGLGGGTNDKKDAFRHAYFNAINTRDVPPGIRPFYVPGSEIVRLFGQAHESEVPSVLELEKQMDLHNNEVGINYCWNCFPGVSSNSSIADAILTRLNNGELRYLKPLDFVLRPQYDQNRDKIQDCPTCTNGIIPGVTSLVPTNQ